MTDSASSELASLADQFGTDKGSHGYVAFYDDLLRARRHEPLRILELGVGGFERPDDPTHGGASLRMWKAYFPAAEIVGLDLYDKSGVAEDRIHIVQGDQTDAALLTALHHDRGPFDVIVDDASHIPAVTNRSFEILFPLLRTGGIYVIEDVATSYWPLWGGRFRRNARGTTMAMAKARLDGLNHAEHKLPRIVASDMDRSILEIRARHNIVAFIKGDNSIPSDLNRANPISVQSWIGSDVLPVIASRAKSPVVLRTLEATRLRPAASAIRRRLVPDPNR